MECPGKKKTLRDLIMDIKGTDLEASLFASIDRKWNGQGYNFSFHPDRLIKASMLIRGLFPRLAYEHGEEVIRCFCTPRAVVEGRRMTYDPEKGTITTEADESMEGLDEIDLDMVEQIDATKESFGERRVFVKERGEDDSVSTFQSKRAPPSEIDTTMSKKAKTNATSSKSSKSSKSSNASNSSTSTLSMTTKNSMNTMHTRITAIESDMKGFQSEVTSKVDLILKSLNIQNPGTVVTPTKNNPPTPIKNNTNNTNETRGKDSHDSDLAQASEDQHGSSKTS